MGIIPGRPEVTFWAYFEPDLPRAIGEQLVSAFGQLQPGALELINIDQVPRERGVYQLRHRGQTVYVGKAEDLRLRLRQHRRKISGRKNIAIADMSFGSLSIHPNWAAYAPEDTVIRHYQEQTLSPWNGMGFGNHDPGRNRDMTVHPSDGWDYQYPIDENFLCEWLEAREWNGEELLKAFKVGLPYLLRYQRTDDVRPDYETAAIMVPEPHMSAESLLRHIAQQLNGWQATRFPSHMILYKEHNQPYNDAVVIWP